MQSGLDAQVSLGVESTYGTAATLDRHIEFTDEALKRSAERIESKSKRPGAKLLAANRWQEGRVGAEGDLGFEVMTKGQAFLWEHALGQIATSTPAGATTARTHTATLGSLFGKSLTVQVGRPDAAGVVQPFTYKGGKVLTWELANEVDGVATLKLGLDFQDEATDIALATWTGPTAADDLDVPLTWVGGVVTLDGTEFACSSFSLSGTNGFKTDRFFIRSGARLKREPVQNERPAAEGEMSTDFEGLTAYNRFVSGTLATLVGRWEGPEVEAGVPFALEVKATIRTDGETPNVNDDDVIEQTLPFTVVDDGSADGGFSVAVTNDSTAP
jgi:hypothetical protein